jgi:hypothetical protein
MEKGLVNHEVAIYSSNEIISKLRVMLRLKRRSIEIEFLDKAKKS